MFRIVSGGVHLSSYERCLFITVLLIAGLAYLLESVAMLLTTEWLYGVLAGAYIFLVPVIFYRVPVGCSNKQFYSDSVKSKFKAFSLLVVTAGILASLAVVIYQPNEPGKSIVLSIMGGLLLQGFTLLPLGHRLFAALERVVGKKEVLL